MDFCRELLTNLSSFVERSYWIVAKEVVGLWKKTAKCFVTDFMLIFAASACHFLLKILISTTGVIDSSPSDLVRHPSVLLSLIKTPVCRC